MTPVMEEVADEVSDDVKIFLVDIDRNKETPSGLGVVAIPLLLLFRDGKETARLGMAHKEEILKAVKALRS